MLVMHINPKVASTWTIKLQVIVAESSKAGTPPGNELLPQLCLSPHPFSGMKSYHT